MIDKRKLKYIRLKDISAVFFCFFFVFCCRLKLDKQNIFGGFMGDFMDYGQDKYKRYFIRHQTIETTWRRRF